MWIVHELILTSFRQIHARRANVKMFQGYADKVFRPSKPESYSVVLHCAQAVPLIDLQHKSQLIAMSQWRTATTLKMRRAEMS